MGEYQIAGGDLAAGRSSCSWRSPLPKSAPYSGQAASGSRLDEVREYLASTRKRQLTDNGDGQGQSGQRRGGGR